MEGPGSVWHGLKRGLLQDYSHHRPRSGKLTSVHPVNATEHRPSYQFVATPRNRTYSPSWTIGCPDFSHEVNLIRLDLSSISPTCRIFELLGSHSTVTVPSMVTSPRSTFSTCSIGTTVPASSRINYTTSTTGSRKSIPSVTRSANCRAIAALVSPPGCFANLAACSFTGTRTTTSTATCWKPSR